MEKGYQTVRCLFCTTGKEELVVQAVEEKGWGKAIFPKRSSPVRKGGEWIEAFKPLLPGYVFVYSDIGQVQQRDFLNVSHVIRVLSYDGERDELTGRDLEFAGWIWQLDVYKRQHLYLCQRKAAAKNAGKENSLCFRSGDHHICLRMQRV